MNNYLSYLFVYYTIYLASALIVLAIKNLFLKKWFRELDFLMVINSILITGLLSLFYAVHPLLLLSNMSLIILLLISAKSLFRSYTYPGINFYIANYLILAVGLVWGTNYMMSMNISWITRILLMAATPLVFFTLPSDVLQMLELYDVVTKEKWHRPKNPFPVRTQSHNPMVSLHVPVHSEPAELVIETLNVLAKQDYDNFEVLVIDNNTTDPNLWMPVKEHCQKLGDTFRFFHLDNMKGAKAGALNFAITQTNPQASVIGVIDADYHAEPDFIKANIGHFDNPKIGFVQTPHDYRGWQKNLFLTMCYWEYKIFFHSAMVSLNERDAGITVGTMCLIRKTALQEAGGWSTWCVTEDSELAIRIHDVGYSSVYVDTTYGRGLIPDTFESYKKQRYRWTAGPVQEFQHHFKHFFGLSKKSSMFTFWQRIFHINHGFDNVAIGFTIPLTLLGFAAIISMIWHHEIINVPFELWLAATIMLIASPVLTWMMYKTIINATFWNIIGQVVAGKALSHTIHYSALKTVLSGNATWTRTNKFKSKHSYLAALYSTKEEIYLGVATALFVAGAYMLFPYPGLSLMFLIGLSYASLNYFTSPLMGLIGVYSMKKIKNVHLKKPTKTPFRFSDMSTYHQYLNSKLNVVNA